ncbi:MAG: SGNH/GDSL hydrolase family protein [Planctomycetes bacterium]|nr:SGNH/GDSL hydrolase family protein [Planctomycetota bacterium]
MKIAAGSRLLFIGDSITDAGRARPVGEGLFEALGKGYVNLVSGMLGAACPERKIRVVNMGTSGNTVRDLKARWKTDVLDLKPDWLAIMIGINDVWRQFDCPLQTEIHVGLKEYEATLNELVSRTQPALKGLVLMTPFFIESSRADAMRARMDEYGAAVKKVAKARGALCVDTQAAFNAYLKHAHSASLAWDRVHPNVIGHTILARAFLKSVGLDA